MIRLQQALAQHWHLSAAAYWQLRLVCAITLGPLLGVLCLVVLHKREKVGPGVARIKRRIQVLTRHSATRLPLRSTASQA